MSENKRRKLKRKILIGSLDSDSEDSDSWNSFFKRFPSTLPQTSRRSRGAIRVRCYSSETDSSDDPVQNSLSRPDFFHAENCLESENLTEALSCVVCLDLFWV